jgi:hypothetical protein
LPHVTELHVRDLRPDTVDMLAPAGRAIEHLGATRAPIEFARYGAFPRLRTLAIADRMPGAEPEAAVRMRAQYVPTLRELSIGGAVDENVVRMLAEELGPQLDLLDLRSSRTAMRFVNTLKPHVRGELVVGDREPTRRLLRATPTIQLPWWDHLTLT